LTPLRYTVDVNVSVFRDVAWLSSFIGEGASVVEGGISLGREQLNQK
jgi:hypothetical protein